MSDDRIFYAESDGGDTWTGSYWSKAPKQFYVVCPDGLQRLDCPSMDSARALAEQLNKGHVTYREAYFNCYGYWPEN